LVFDLDDEPEGALAALGRCVGELAQELAIREVIVRLQKVAPPNWLDKVQRFPAQPSIARPGAERFATIAQEMVKRELDSARRSSPSLNAQIANIRDLLPDDSFFEARQHLAGRGQSR
jgi:hypothetical protein